jgi:lipopolysaccharide/colanic/teichoic acid biosynthesis glycosyltransferase
MASTCSRFPPESQEQAAAPPETGFVIPLGYDPSSRKVRAKRVFDATASTLALVALLPVFLIIALVIKLTSRGPIFFAQERVGSGGRLFKLYKFRTMVVNAEALKATLHAQNEADGPVFKMVRDPRVTRTGRLLRKYSLDELPQLYSIIRGNMSIVGPRPPLPSEVQQYKPHQLRRLSVPQGLTCIWQISGRSNVSFEDWVSMDLRYIDTWSLRLDLKIILKTFKVVAQGQGAY